MDVPHRNRGQAHRDQHGNPNRAVARLMHLGLSIGKALEFAQIERSRNSTARHGFPAAAFPANIDLRRARRWPPRPPRPHGPDSD